MSTHNQLQVTYNQIIAKIQEFADQHEQVGQFGNGDLWEAVEHNQDGPFKYPLLWAVDNTWSITDKSTASGISTLESTYSIAIMDLVKKDESNENEVLSDTIQVLLDLQAYLERDADANWDRVKLVRNTRIDPFTESLNDEVSGWTFTLTLRQPMIFDNCGIAPASICRPAYVTNSDGVTVVEVDSGASFACDVCASLRVSNSNDSYDVSISSALELPDINFTDTDGSPVAVPSMEDLVCAPSAKDIDLRFNFSIGDDTTDTHTITAFEAGTYTSIADDGGSGTITISVNAGAYVTFVNPTVLVNTDTVAIKRTITTAVGQATITGTYV